MKRVLLFIGLKIVEISCIIIAYLLLSRFGWFLMNLTYKEDNLECWYNFLYFIGGSLVIVLVGLVLALMYFLITEVIPNWLKSNWEWSGRILNK